MKKIFLVLLASVFLSGCNRLDEHQPLTSQIVKFVEGDTLTHSIHPSRNHLNTVNICLRNFERALIPLTFTLSENNRVIRTIEFSSGNIDNADCTKFRFEAIADSAGKTYLVTISSAKPDKNKLLPSVLTVEKHQDVLHYKTFYYQSLADAIQESFTQLSARLLQDPFFLIVYFVTLLVMLAYLLKSK